MGSPFPRHPMCFFVPCFWKKLSSKIKCTFTCSWVPEGFSYGHTLGLIATKCFLSRTRPSPSFWRPERSSLRICLLDMYSPENRPTWSVLARHHSKTCKNKTFQGVLWGFCGRQHKSPLTTSRSRHFSTWAMVSSHEKEVEG